MQRNSGGTHAEEKTEPSENEEDLGRNERECEYREHTNASICIILCLFLESESTAAPSESSDSSAAMMLNGLLSDEKSVCSYCEKEESQARHFPLYISIFGVSCLCPYNGFARGERRFFGRSTAGT